MKLEDFSRTMIILGTTYGKDITQEQIAIWYTFFENENSDLFKKAVKNIINKSKYMPTVAEIKEEMLNIVDNNMQLNAEDEYQNLLEYIHRGGTYTFGEEYFKTLNPITQKCIETIGKNLLMEAPTTEFENIRRDFIRYFNSYKSNYKNEALCGKSFTERILTGEIKMIGE